MTKKAQRKATTPESRTESTMAVEPLAVVDTPAPAIETKKKFTPHRHTGTVIYFAGIITALLSAIIVPYGSVYCMYALLAIIGFLVGLMNITEKEVLLFLVATVAFVVSANAVRGVLGNVPAVEQFLSNVIIFTAASAFVVSMKAIIKVAKTE